MGLIVVWYSHSYWLLFTLIYFVYCDCCGLVLCYLASLCCVMFSVCYDCVVLLIAASVASCRMFGLVGGWLVPRLF